MVRLRIFQELFQRYRRPGDLIFAFVFLFFALFLLSQLGEQTVKRNESSPGPLCGPMYAVTSNPK